VELLLNIFLMASVTLTSSMPFMWRKRLFGSPFQLRVGIDPVPLLQEKPFQEHQRRIGVGALAAAPDGIMRQKNLFHLRPVDDTIDLLESFEAAVMFHGFQKRDFGEGHIPIDLFVSHIPSSKKFDGENMAQIRRYVK
jgi:hypothetical protein